MRLQPASVQYATLLRVGLLWECLRWRSQSEFVLTAAVKYSGFTFIRPRALGETKQSTALSCLIEMSSV